MTPIEQWIEALRSASKEERAEILRLLGVAIAEETPDEARAQYEALGRAAEALEFLSADSPWIAPHQSWWSSMATQLREIGLRGGRYATKPLLETIHVFRNVSERRGPCGSLLPPASRLFDETTFERLPTMASALRDMAADLEDD